MLSHLQTVSGGHVEGQGVERFPQKCIFTADVEWMKYVFNIQPPKMTLPKKGVLKRWENPFDKVAPRFHGCRTQPLKVKRSWCFLPDGSLCWERRDVREVRSPFIWLSCDLESVRADADLSSCLELFTGMFKQIQLCVAGTNGDSQQMQTCTLL